MGLFPPNMGKWLAPQGPAGCAPGALLLVNTAYYGGEKTNSGLTKVPPKTARCIQTQQQATSLYADPPPRAHNFRASARVYATGECGGERFSGSGGGAAAQVDFFWFWWCAIFLIQENCSQVGTASGTPRPTDEKPNSEPSRPQVDFCEPTPGRFLPFVAS